MSPHLLGSLRSEPSSADVISLELHRIEVERRVVADSATDVVEALAEADQDQLARDIAHIDRATLALKQAEPALQPWTGPQATLPGNPRSVWLLIATLWISAALIATGAVVVIATIVG